MPNVPVLMYHHVNPNKGDMVTVTPEVFKAQMRHIRDAGYRTLSLDELVGFMEGKVPLSGKSVAVTFDDGYLDNYIYAYPVMKAYGIRASVFVVSKWADGASSQGGASGQIEGFMKNPPTHRQTKDLISEGNFSRVVMDWEMIKEMRSCRLVEFHSHTMTHVDCGSISASDLERELGGSKEAIENRLGCACDYLCWPRGRFNEDAVMAAKASGYRGVFTTRHGVADEKSDPFRVKRIVVKDGVGWFKTRLGIYSNRLLSGAYMKVSGKK